MRERAEVCAPAPWILRAAVNYGGGTARGVDIIGALRDPVAPRVVAHVDPWGGKQEADHIASWHPAVALAVADWIDAAAVLAPPDPHHEGEACETCDNVTRALAVARAYLGVTS